jgi:hypothetical protein
VAHCTPVIVGVEEIQNEFALGYSSERGDEFWGCPGLSEQTNKNARRCESGANKVASIK